jgi:hypothetical protein
MTIKAVNVSQASLDKGPRSVYWKNESMKETVVVFCLQLSHQSCLHFEMLRTEGLCFE